MNSIVILFALATFISTLVGGLVILKFKNSLPYFFAFAAGTLIAISFLDLLPESLQIANSIALPTKYIMITVVLSFFLYSLVEKYFLTHEMHDHDSHAHILGPIGAGSLVVHSFLDGIAIGAAFHVSNAVGLVIALAVLCHDFTDGINTVAIMLKNKQRVKNALTFLIFDALAPVLGVLVTYSISIPQKALAILLAFFVGEFLYIGASSLLPETHHHSRKTIIAMAIGIILIIILTSLISI